MMKSLSKSNAMLTRSGRTDGASNFILYYVMLTVSNISSYTVKKVEPFQVCSIFTLTYLISQCIFTKENFIIMLGINCTYLFISLFTIFFM